MGLLLASLSRSGIDVPPIVFGLAAASFYLAELLGAPWFGALSDRKGRRLFLVIGPMFGLLAVQLIGWPSLALGFPLLLVPIAVGRLTEGLSTASTAPATLSFLSAATTSSTTMRGRVMAWYEMTTVVGIGGGYVLAGPLWDLLGHAAFLLVTAIYGLSLVAFAVMRDPHAGHALDRPHGSPWRVLRRRAVLRFAPAWLAVNTIVGAWSTHSSFQLVAGRHLDQYLSGGFSATMLGVGFGIFSAAFVIGIFFWGATLGMRRKTSTMLITMMGTYVVCGALLAINHLAQHGPGWRLVFTLCFALGVMVMSGFTPVALAHLADISEEIAEERGTVMGLYSVLFGLGQFLGAALGGPFAEFGSIDGLIALTLILATISVGTVLFLRREEARERGERGGLRGPAIADTSAV
jgi:MFS family permease